MRIDFIAASFGALCGACGHQCTEMGCMPSVTLELAAPLAEDGEYEFTVTADGTTTSCRAFVPLRRDGSEPLCEGFYVNREEITTREGDGVVGRAGDAITSVAVQGRPEALMLTVARNGSEILNVQVNPTYRGVEINGEGCGECPIATQRVGE